MTLPIARFSPSPGVTVDRTQRTTRITGVMELYGPEASPVRATTIQSWINRTWTQRFADGYSVRCRIRVVYRAPGTQSSSVTQIEAIRGSGPSHVSPGLFGRTMTLNANNANAFGWTAAHEFGHILGLDDRYSEEILSKLRGTFGGRRQTTPQAGYGNNLMAVHGGRLEQSNLRDFAEETSPSPYWINDDDHVRDWVTSHSFGEIRRLATVVKLSAIHTLMGGWISDADVSVIKRILSSVSRLAEAQSLRAGIDLLTFTSLGQRMEVRVALSKMPRA